jgi:hypothetical protein
MTNPRASLRLDRLTSGARSSRGSTEDYPRDAEPLDGQSRGNFPPGCNWQPEELGHLHKMMRAGLSVKAMVAALGRSESSVRKRVAVERTPKNFTMTEVRRDLILKHWGAKPAQRIGNILGMSADQVREAAVSLGLDLAAEAVQVEAIPVPRRPRGWTRAEVEACRDAGGPEWALMSGMLGIHGRKDQAAKGMEG